MSNEEHLKIIKQGVKVWNRWREENPKVRPDFSGANLDGADLRMADLKMADLSEADLSGADLSDADLRLADLRLASLIGAVLRSTNLNGAVLYGANFSGANLRRTRLSAADLSNSRLEGTEFSDVNLSQVRGLETVEHRGPSTIGADTLQRSRGTIPEVFLRGCGLSDWEIEAAKLYRFGLTDEEIIDILYEVRDLRARQPIQANKLFISYSHADNEFVDHMERHLNNKGIRFWRDVHHATAGRLEKQIDHAIRHNPTVLLILSKHSTESDWVEHEARLARKLEIEMERDVLCPVALDDSWKTCQWPERLREQIMEYNILDFSKWEDEAFFGRMFTKLIDGLDLFYKE